MTKKLLILGVFAALICSSVAAFTTFTKQTTQSEHAQVALKKKCRPMIPKLPPVKKLIEEIPDEEICTDDAEV